MKLHIITPSQHQQNIDLLTRYGARHLNPLPSSAVEREGVSASSFSSHISSSIDTVQQLLNDPDEFFDVTLLSLPKFFLLHSHVKDAILSPRTHRHSTLLTSIQCPPYSTPSSNSCYGSSTLPTALSNLYASLSLTSTQALSSE